MADPTWTDGVTPLNAENMVKLQTRDEKGAVNGYAPLDTNGKVPASLLPPPTVTGATLTYRGTWAAGTYVDGDVAVYNGVAYLCVGGPTVVAPDPDLWDDAAAPVTTTPWVPMWVLTPGAAVPTGVLTQFAGAVAPSGYLLCDGALYLQTAYPALFAVLGTAYGGDATQFAVPDLQGRMPVGKGGRTEVDTIGKNEGIALANRTPLHGHTVNDPSHTHGIPYGSIGGPVGDPNGRNYEGSRASLAAYTGITVGPAGVGAVDTPSFLVVNYIIKT